ncbi:putative glutamine-N5 methyltransferase [Clostridioides difficile CD8]|nr:putative glutamine-N5 methyltransferase [Clostridioides difficile CD8]
MTIKDIIIKYSDKLKDISDTPRLDTSYCYKKHWVLIDYIFT